MSFVSRPMPATSPSNGYRRGSGRPRIRSATYENATQTGTSSIVGWNSTPRPSPYGVSANATAASSWLRKPPPSSRAHSATSTIETIPASTPVRRSATSDGPATSTTSRPTTAVAGGKSTYPSDRCLLACRKYSSSRSQP